jgi:alpha-tubulin suppressor-like RCC1 family protein
MGAIRWLGIGLLVGLVVALSGCQPEASNCSVDSECGPGEVCAEAGGLLFVGGVCVARAPQTFRDAGDAGDAAIPPDGSDASCIPQSCQENAQECGQMPNTCGGTPQECGDCSGDFHCNGGECTDQVCQPPSCQDMGAECGSVFDDNCSQFIECGACASGQQCEDNRCCQPTTCAELGVSCGTYTDGCGSTIQCGPSSCIADIAAGLAHTCVARGDGSVLCWGANESGQLGKGDFSEAPTPTSLSMANAQFDALAIGAGSSHSCALSRDGSLWCWGANGVPGTCYGQLGTSDDCNALSGTNRPVRPVDLSEVSGEVVELVSMRDSNCLRTDTGLIYCWGRGTEGQVGDGANSSDNLAPTQVEGLSAPSIEVALSDCYGCALTSETVVCWGDHDDGCSGDGQPNSAVELHSEFSFDETSALAGGGAHNCFSSVSGQIHCFNDNRFGQLGISNSTPRSTTPVEVTALDDQTIVDVVAGATHTCALTEVGTVSCWGDNQYGKLGNGSEVDSDQPVEVEFPRAARQITAGIEHTCAVLETNVVQCWGKNFDGQLGTGESGANTFSTQPVTVDF